MENKLLTYEEFFEEVWDYVSGKVVDDNYWEAHYDLIKETTFNLYNIFDKTSVNEGGMFYTSFSTKVAAKILESFFSSLQSYGYNKPTDINVSIH